MIVITAVTAIVGALGLLASLVLLIVQVRELIRQTELNNSIGIATVTQGALTRLHELQFQIMNDPRLYPYFYAGKAASDDPDERAKVAIAAEIMADVVDLGLVTDDLLPKVQNYSGWSDYSVFLLQRSPVLTEVITAHPAWYPHWHREITKNGHGKLLARQPAPLVQTPD